MRRRQSLAGTDRLGKDPRPQLALDGILHDQIDWSAEDGFQPALDPEEMEEPHRLVELDQEVHITARTPSRRARRSRRDQAIAPRTVRALLDAPRAVAGLPRAS